MRSLRPIEGNNSELEPAITSSEILPHFPSEALNGFEEQKLKNMGNTALEMLFIHLGISLDDKETILSLLTDLQKQIDENDENHKDDFEAHSVFQDKTIWPQARALNEMIAQRIPPGWKVHGPSIWSDSSVILEKENKEVQIFLNEKGFQLITYDHDIYWKEMPDKEKTFYLAFLQQGRKLKQPAPICLIKSNTEHWDLGVLSLYRTQDARVSKPPYFGDIITAKEPVTKVVYSKTGKPQYIEVRVPLQEPGLAKQDQPTLDTDEYIIYTYDLSQGLETGIHPVYTHMQGSATPIETDIFPHITVDEYTLMVQFGSREDFFPLAIEGGIMKMAKDGLEVIEKLYPPKPKRARIIDRLTQGNPKLRKIFSKNLLSDE